MQHQGAGFQNKIIKEIPFNYQRKSTWITVEINLSKEMYHMQFIIAPCEGSFVKAVNSH